MTSLQSLPADALALRDLRQANPRALPAPPVLTPTLRAQLPSHPGYAFSWGQLIECPGDLPDPDSEAYAGTRWAIVPTSVWEAIHPRLRATGRHLYQLLDSALSDGTDCVECALPPFVYLDAPRSVVPFGFFTLSGTETAEARRWLVESFLVDKLPVALAGYEQELLQSIDEFRQLREDRLGERP